MTAWLAMRLLSKPEGLNLDPQSLHWKLGVCWHTPVNPVLGRKKQESVGLQNQCFSFSKRPWHRKKKKKMIEENTWHWLLTSTPTFTQVHTHSRRRLPTEGSMWNGGRYTQLGAETDRFYSVHCSDRRLEKWQQSHQREVVERPWVGFTFCWPLIKEAPVSCPHSVIIRFLISHEDHSTLLTRWVVTFNSKKFKAVVWEKRKKETIICLVLQSSSAVS